MFFKKCLILNRSFKWSVIKTVLWLAKRFCSASVGSQTGRDNMFALAISVPLAVFPFLDWDLDFLLRCLHRKTQTTQEHHVGVTVFGRSCSGIEGAPQLPVQPFSFGQTSPLPLLRADVLQQAVPVRCTRCRAAARDCERAHAQQAAVPRASSRGCMCSHSRAGGLSPSSLYT